MKPKTIDAFEEDAGRPGPYDPPEGEDLWFLPEVGEESGPLQIPSSESLVDGAAWRAAEATLATDLAELTFDLGRLAERVRSAGPGAAQRLALEEASAISWWTGNRVGADRLAL
jgi:hypothetical protein